MKQAYICDAIRTPIGRYGGTLSSVRTDDLGAIPLKALMARNPDVDWSKLEEVVFGCANQAGEDNRNIARMSALLAGLPDTVPGSTINRLCGSGMDALGVIARAIKADEIELGIAGGVESMSRAPFVMGKADTAFSRTAQIEDTTIGWRFINKLMKEKYGVDTMPQTADNVAEDYKINRADQDLFALNSQKKWQQADAQNLFEEELIPVTLPQRKGDPIRFSRDEHPRADTTLDKLATLKGINGADKTVTAGNASGVNDGACALLVASENAVTQHGLTPKARILGMATAGVAPQIMGIGPAPATRKVLAQCGLSLDDMDIIELNEAFASQALAVLRGLGLDDNDPRVNPQGGAIALGHPLGMSGARLVTTATYQLHRQQKRYALCTMCIGVGQGIAMIIERV
ncbi:3-oxoadipyl-CoA thiolase [Terasakiella pusilla]|uniref:3-oxoadipyl-CoA thiolase n=1 Tax=Terasakiella pusilla TaxID=64973 RepID=UPI003AA93C72